jgi:hypothetical protein
MKRSYFSRNLLIILILTAITVFVWIGIETYQILTRQEFPKVVQKQLEPLDPAIDTKTIEDLSNKKNYLKEDLGMSGIETPVPSPIITP